MSENTIFSARLPSSVRYATEAESSVSRSTESILTGAGPARPVTDPPTRRMEKSCSVTPLVTFFLSLLHIDPYRSSLSPLAGAGCSAARLQTKGETRDTQGNSCDCAAATNLHGPARRRQIIYIAGLGFTLRGIHATIVTARGGQPAFFSGVLTSQTASLLPWELDERSRLLVVVIGEAHPLGNMGLEALQTLARTEMDTGSQFALLLIGKPTCAADSNSRSWQPWSSGSPPASRSPAWNRSTPRTTSVTNSNSPAASIFVPRPSSPKPALTSSSNATSNRR